MIPEFKTGNHSKGLLKGSIELIDLIYCHPTLIGKRE